MGRLVVLWPYMQAHINRAFLLSQSHQRPARPSPQKKGWDLWDKAFSHETDCPLWQGLGNIRLYTVMEKTGYLASIFKIVCQNCISFSGMCLQASCVERTQGIPGAALSQKQIYMARRAHRPQLPPSHPASVSLGLSLPREHAIAKGPQKGASLHLVQSCRKDFSNGTFDSKLDQSKC